MSIVHKGGFSKERYQELRINWGLIPAVGDLKSAANTVLGTVMVPLSWGSIDLKFLGIAFQAAGGAETTSGVLKLQKNGVDVVDSTGVAITVSSVASHAKGGVAEVSLNQTLAANNLKSEPVYTALAAGDVLTFVVLTQGAGAGDQTVIPYILFSETPGQQ